MGTVHSDYWINLNSSKMKFIVALFVLLAAAYSKAEADAEAQKGYIRPNLYSRLGGMYNPYSSLYGGSYYNGLVRGYNNGYNYPYAYSGLRYPYGAYGAYGLNQGYYPYSHTGAINY